VGPVRRVHSQNIIPNIEKIQNTSVKKFSNVSSFYESDDSWRHRDTYWQIHLPAGLVLSRTSAFSALWAESVTMSLRNIITILFYREVGFNTDSNTCNCKVVSCDHDVEHWTRSAVRQPSWHNVTVWELRTLFRNSKYYRKTRRIWLRLIAAETKIFYSTRFIILIAFFFSLLSTIFRLFSDAL
jgi:hypothetical protein